MEEIIVIGGGASGLVAAIIAARDGFKVTIIEHKDKLGKKILATGNGKCNYTNMVQRQEDYRSDNSEFPFSIIKRFTEEDTLEFFQELGIYPKVRNGYVYPYSEQATSVVNVLSMELERLKVRIQLSTKVSRIHKKKDKFVIETNNGSYSSDKVILAAGGCASSSLGSDGSGFALAKELGHSIIKPLPALVQLVSKEKYFKTLAGVRCNAKVELYSNGKLLSHEYGEILMANYGLSGIPILQISRYAARALDKKEKVEVRLDFLPELSYNDAKNMMMDRINGSKHKNVEEMLIGLFNHKLAYVILMQSKIQVDKLVTQLSEKERKLLLDNMKSFSVMIHDTQPFEQAQVSSGGVNTKEINPKTMESQCIKGLYLAGEVLDVDGTCGGYNLQWAFASGYLAAKGLKDKG